MVRLIWLFLFLLGSTSTSYPELPTGAGTIPEAEAAPAQSSEEQAIAEYTAAIADDPTDASAYYNRGNLHSALGQYEQALADYTQAIALDPNDATAYYNRGLVHSALGQYKQALADFEAALALDPDAASAFFYRGKVYYVRTG